MGAASKIVQAAIEVLAKKSGGALPDTTLPIRPARENLRTVVDSNTIGGRVSGDEMVPIDSLSGGPSLSARGQKAVDDIVEQMSGPDGFIERLIVDQDNNVIEGAHRVEALRRLGIEQVPITRVVDPTANLDLPKMGEAIKAVGPIHSDHVNQITAQVGDMLAEVGGDPAKVLQEFDLPKGFERFFRAALDSVSPKTLPTDEASRMARAREMGFDSQTYYHYSEAPNIEKFDPKAPDSWGQTDDRGASYFTSDPDYAEKLMLEKAEAKDFTDYKSIEEYLDILSGSDLAATTYPVKIKTDKIFDYNDENAVDDLIDSFGKYMGREFGDNAESLLRSGDWSILEMPALQEALKDAGYRGYKTSEPGTVGLFYPDKGDVRSIFAKFDPAKSESGEILASVPAIATGLAGYGALSNVVEENNGQRSN